MAFFRFAALIFLITNDLRGARAWLAIPPAKRQYSSTRLLSSQRPEESSQMFNFIRNYLNQNNNNYNNVETVDSSNRRNSKHTTNYLIAIPMETCHELALELESIQRAILYHCPILVHACVPAAALRVPLLQVETTASHDEGNSNVLPQLQSCIDTVMQQSALQTEPWMVAWKGLQGKEVGNSVLYATSDHVSPFVKSFVQHLNETLRQQAPDWTLSWALQQVEEQGTRLHLPFLQLPEQWEMILREEYNITLNGDDDDENNQRYTLTSDQGGNGISPLFWIQYMDDALGQDLLRLPEVGLYASSGENQAFSSWPSWTWPLPVGTNQTILRREREFQGYQDERMQKAEKSLKRPTVSNEQTMSNKDELSEPNDDEEEDIMMLKTRQRLEQLYAESDSETTIKDTDSADDVLFSGGDDETRREIDSAVKPNRPETPQDPAILDGWMRENIQKVIASRARERSLQELSTKKEKPAIEDNPIFAKFKNGTLVPETPKVASSPTPSLPPYPSREHLVGFWRMVRSPTGFEPVENGNDRSENLILRIDGTTAGGPILDQETQQKASGGTWSLSGETATSARLLIRLEIPPKKERVLVMEGALERVSMKGQDMPLASNTFGIPALEQLKSQNAVEMEDYLFCGGQVWIEDVITGRNRDEIGSFSVMKLNLSTDPTQYSITVPRPVRNQD